MQIITASRIAFAIRTEQSPLTPSFIEPITAIAPIQTVQDALTNADTNESSPVLWLFILSHSPNLSTRAFILIISPIRPPKVRLTIIITVPLVDSLPSDSDSIFCITPPTASIIIATALTDSRVSFILSFSFLPNSNPHSPPNISRATFITVPSPRIKSNP